MATLNDLNELRELMELAVKDSHQVWWFGNIALTYSHTTMCWLMQFDCDLTVQFDRAEYSSNNIVLYRNDVPISWFCHTHHKLR